MNASPLAAGDLVAGRFEVLALGGEGGMALVYRARDRTTGELVALKVLSEAREIERFRAEADTLARIRSPFVVGYVAHGDHAGRAWLAMEWLEGESLDERVARAPLSPSDAVALATKIARGLGAAHALGIVHRDVKPENVVLVEGVLEDPRLLDFGVARLPGKRFTEPGIVLGTPGFFAPEQARVDGTLDPRADVFALGSLLYECITGEPLWTGDSVLAILTKILFEPAPRLDRAQPGVSPALADLVERMLAKEPEGRPADGNAVAALLEGLETRDTSLPPPPPRAIGTGARSVASVLVVRPQRGALTPALAGRIRELGVRFEVSFEALTDGSLVALVSGPRVATDLAAIAVRLALAVRAVLGEGAIAVGTGRASLGDRSELGAVIARAAALASGHTSASRTVLVDPTTAGLLGPRFALVAHEGAVAVTGENDVAAREPVEVRGRREELARIAALFARTAAESSASMAVLEGEAGIGKSVVASAALRQLADHESLPTVLGARGEPLHENAPFGLVAELLRHAIALRPSEGPEALDRIVTWIGARLDGAEAAQALSVVEELLRVGRGAERSALFDGTRGGTGTFADRVHDALTALFGAECRGVPLVLFVEDLHFADAPSVEALGVLLDRLALEPFFVLATARPDARARFPALFAREPVASFSLAPLDDATVRGWAREVLGAAADAAKLEEAVRAAGGSPVVLRELLRALSSGGETRASAASMLLHGRLASLPAELARAMRAAAVLGIADAAQVAHLLGILPSGETGAERLLEELVREDVLVREARGGMVRYPFRSRLLQDVAYGMLTSADRSLAHGLAAEWLEARGGSAALVAEHWSRAKRPERAARAFSIAAQDALAASDVSLAATLAERGLSHAPPDATRADLLASLAEARLWQGDPAAGRAAATEALALATTGSLAEASALSVLLTAVARLGDVDALESLASDAVLVPISPTSAPVMAHALARGGMNLIFLGRFEAGSALLAQLRELAEAVPEPAVQARWLQAQAIRAHYEGDLVGHVRFAEQALALLDAIGDRRTAAVLRTNVGDALRSLGRLDEAEAALRAALEVCRTMRIGSVEAPLRANLGATLTRLGKLDEAVPLLSSVSAELTSAGDRRLAASAGLYLAEALLAKGSLPEARAAIEGAERHSAAGTPLHPPVLAMAARIALAEGRADDAYRLASRAMEELASLSHVEDDELAVHLAWVLALRARGDEAAARDATRTALARLDALASKIGDEASARAFREHVPAHRALAAIKA